ncbi:MAG: PmoA family protein [Armatimonadota bacterium]|nr:MAG: PmoA family protein [Armatimonadota bacterium]
MKETKLRASAGPHHRHQCPLVTRIPWSGDPPPAAFGITDLTANHTAPAQLLPGLAGAGEICFAWVVEDLAPDHAREFLLTPEAPEARPGVELVEAGAGRLEVNIDGGLFTAYNFHSDLARPNLHPLCGPGGRHMTRDYPMADGPAGETRDHVHHRSVWIAHGEVNHADNWSEGEGHACTVHREFARTEAGPVMGAIEALSDWVTADGKRLLNERAEFAFYNLPAEWRCFDLSVDLTPAEGEVLFGDTKEGGICAVRVASSMDASGEGRIENSYGGTDEDETWGKRAHWCDYSGPVRGEIVGIAVFDHPDSFRHPTYWHVRNYGLMTANPFGLSHFYDDPARDGSHVLKPGETMSFRYRIYLHLGDAAAGAVAEKYHDFINPPHVEVV